MLSLLLINPFKIITINKQPYFLIDMRLKKNLADGQALLTEWKVFKDLGTMGGQTFVFYS